MALCRSEVSIIVVFMSSAVGHSVARCTKWDSLTVLNVSYDTDIAHSFTQAVCPESSPTINLSSCSSLPTSATSKNLISLCYVDQKALLNC